MDFVLDHYCNYPEVSKPRKIIPEERTFTDLSSEHTLSPTKFDLSSETDLFSWKIKSLSMLNYLSSSSASEDSDFDQVSESEESAATDSTDTFHSKGKDFGKETSYCRISRNHPLIDPMGWIKFASDLDPWNKENYFPIVESHTSHDGVLTHQLVSACSGNLEQLPDNKAFVLTRLHLNNKGLEDVTVLSSYRYFQYIDVSWNSISDLTALSSCDYLMYLNASHNQLSQVLEFSPPWFLTHINLSCNKIQEIGNNISKFWSLRHIDLSYNLIERIEGLDNLMYLIYLDLSHNHIKKIENIDCINIETIHLEFNEISDCNTKNAGLRALKNIMELNIANNRLSCLSPFQTLYSLKKLDISNNCISELDEISYFTCFSNFKDLNMIGNPVWSNNGCREFIICKLPTLKSLNCVPICSSERVAAKMLLNPDLFTKTQYMRAKIELWNQLASQEINTETVPSNHPPVPLVVLVGTFSNYKEEIAKTLALKCPDQVYRCKKHTTMPLVQSQDTENHIPVSLDEFNNMIKTGQFILYYTEVGHFFGVDRTELCKCIVDDKVGLIDTVLEAAMVLRSSGFSPFIVLTAVDDEENYANKLRHYFMDMDLWTLYCKTKSEEEFRSTFNKKSDESNLVCQTDSASSENISELNAITNPQSVQTYKNGSDLIPKIVSWGLDKTLLSEVLENYEDLDDEIRSTKEKSFVWSWSLESSVESLDEPDENCLNMVRGRETFVKNTLLQQAMHIETNNLHPGLFVDTILTTDNITDAVKKVAKICFDILNHRKNNQKCIGDVIEESLCSKLVKERVTFFKHDLLNVSTEI